MCGIAGRLSWQHPANRHLVTRMTRSLAHRGPDAQGIYCQGPMALGHRRLSIIDLDPQSNQPMVHPTGEQVIVFNGEIYNFQELRRELTALGSRFVTKGDTEVILEAYRQWGLGCLRRLAGMFAFALWDEPRQRLLLARDRLGKKPLYYYPLADGGVAFASELNALLQDPQLPRQVNLTALSHFLSLNYTLHQHPMVQGVKRLAAASYVVVEQEGISKEHLYWDLAHYFHNKVHYNSDAEAAEACNALLEEAVRPRLVSDVPLGAFLSGGIDSSAVVAAMCRFQGAEQVTTFSAGFRQASYDETTKSLLVAKLLGVNHVEEMVEPVTAHMLPQLVRYLDEPFADTSLFPMFRLAELAKKQVTVVLTGDGGDELFGGYSTYTADQLHHVSRWIPGWLTHWIGRAADRLLPVSLDKVGIDFQIRQFLSGHAHGQPRAHYSWRTIFQEQEKVDLVLPEWQQKVAEADPCTHFEEAWQQMAGCHYLDRAMYVDFKTWLVDDILVKVDRTTMAHGLEARCPFLDHRLVEFAASLPVRFKIKGLQRKHILKRSQSTWLPANIVHRRKEGFSAPVSHWLIGKGENDFSQFRRLALAPDYLRQDRVGQLWNDMADRTRDNGMRLLGLIMFHLWLEKINRPLSHQETEPNS
ncbi:MAG: asparagine synthase (glutamine-hydrolyzing) [Magnetococcales bacterium]|nr:asparagine synthase (glutamine-hydrolyzing) [Magnetococcales bacterium]NGZ25325.1 asparagine synthase (glutamine-hydrolyzing) [Magnetococcales bacterium]